MNTVAIRNFVRNIKWKIKSKINILKIIIQWLFKIVLMYINNEVKNVFRRLENITKKWIENEEHQKFNESYIQHDLYHI